MSVWSRIYPTASDRFEFNKRHWAVADTTAAAAATATEGRVVGGDRATAPRRRCRGVSVTSAAEDDVRPRIISESQISETISQTNMHGSNYHESKQACRPNKYNKEPSILLYTT